jgi:hypothetical protein
MRRDDLLLAEIIQAGERIVALVTTAREDIGPFLEAVRSIPDA